MNIQVSIALGPDDDIPMSTAEAAVAILNALNGDPSKDTVMVSATAPTAVHGVGALPPVTTEPVPEPIPEPLPEPLPEPVPEPPTRP